MIAYIVAVIAFYVGRFGCSSSVRNSDWGDFGSYFGGMMSVVSIFLLYKTLRLQKENIDQQQKQFIQQQFETTYFNMLEYHRELTDKGYVIVTTVSNSLQIKHTDVRGRQFFTYALWVMEKIAESLKSKSYMGTFDIKKEHKRSIAIDYEYSEEYDDEYIELIREKQEEKHLYNCKIMHINSLYLPLKKWEKLHQEENDKQLKKESFNLFYEKHFNSYENYIRRLKQLLAFIVEHNQDEDSIVKYAKYIQMQMTQDELKFVELHSNLNAELKSLLKQTQLTKIK